MARRCNEGSRDEKRVIFPDETIVDASLRISFPHACTVSSFCVVLFDFTSIYKTAVTGRRAFKSVLAGWNLNAFPCIISLVLLFSPLASELVIGTVKSISRMMQFVGRRIESFWC